MARQTLEVKDFTFVGGLNTEAGVLTFPQNAWLDGDNVVPKIDGSIERRNKMDYESGYVVSATTFSQSSKEALAYTSHRWEGVGGNGNLNLIVVQKGSIISFYNTAGSSLSSGEKSFTIDLATYRVSASPNAFGTQPIACATGNGKLIIVSEDTDPILVIYTAATDSIAVTTLTLKIRDLYGVNDGLTADNKPATLSALHNYNLLNQGWDSTKITAYQVSQGVYPANSQIWIQGKDATDTFDPALLAKQDFGTSLAPKGRYILSLFSRDRTTASGVSSLTTESETARPRAVAFFAGRAWYGGTRSTTISSWVMFTQVVDTDVKYAYCYQEGDPTAEFTNDLIASDGGVIIIPDAGSVNRLVVLQDSIIVFAENGLWQILGDNGGFSATGYQVKKLTSFGCVSALSVVEFENTLAFWSTSGVFLLQKDNVSGDFIPQNLSLNKVQTLYTAISGASKRYSQGFYDQENKRLYWLYQQTPNTDTVSDRYKKDKVLVFDTRLQSWYKFSIPSLATNSPTVVGGVLSVNPGVQSVDFGVIDSVSDGIITSASDVVIASIDSVSNAAKIPKYLTITQSGTTYSVTFSDFEATQDAPYKFKDWYSVDSVGTEPTTLPYIITGYQVLDSGSHELQAPYIHTFMKRTETGVDSNGDAINGSSATLQGRWEWADNTIAGRWTAGEEVYRHRRLFIPSAIPSSTYTDGYPVVVAKSKMRGKGKNLSLKYSAATGKDMKIAGWSVVYNKNVTV